MPKPTRSIKIVMKIRTSGERLFAIYRYEFLSFRRNQKGADKAAIRVYQFVESWQAGGRIASE
jgi:hypothetical protein